MILKRIFIILIYDYHRKIVTDIANLTKRGWKECKLGDVASYVNRGVSPLYVDEEAWLKNLTEIEIKS